MELKIISYNIHKGLTPFRKLAVEDQISYAINAYDPDIVFLQEVWRRDEINESTLEGLCSIKWRHKCYGKNALFPRGSQGNAILSKYPIICWDNYDISVHGREPRGILHATILTPNGELEAYSIHFGLAQSERYNQMRFLTEKAKHPNPLKPIILAGDFNDWNKKLHPLAIKSGFKEVQTEIGGKLAKTFPAFAPLLPLDRIYIKNAFSLRSQFPHFFSNLLSDHLPYYAELRV